MPHPTTHNRVAWRVFGGALLLYLASMGGSLTSTDAVVTFDLTRSLVEDRSVALSGNLLGLESNRGTDGRYYSQYGIGQSVYGIPFYAAGRMLLAVVGPGPAKPDSLLKAAVSASSSVAAAGAVAAVFLLTFAIQKKQRPALFAAALACTGSLLFPYAGFGFNAPLTACILTTTALLMWHGVREVRHDLLVVAGCVAGFGWLTRHEFPLVIAPLLFWLTITPGPSGAVRRLAALLPGITAAGGLWVWYNLARFGRPFFVGYEPEYTGEGFAGLLLSPGASVFLYWPAIGICAAGLMLMRRVDRASLRLLLWPALAVFLYAGLLRDWPGGRSYGPRYLVPVMPLLTVGAGALFAWAGPRGRRWLALSLVAACCLQLPGVLVDYSRVNLAWAQTATQAQLAQRMYLWDASPIVRNTKAVFAAVPRNLAYLTGQRAIPAIERHGGEADRAFAQQFAFSLDFWWLYAFYLGLMPAGLAVSIGGSLWAGAVVLSVQAWRIAGLQDSAPDTPASGRQTPGQT